MTAETETLIRKICFLGFALVFFLLLTMVFSSHDSNPVGIRARLQGSAERGSREILFEGDEGVSTSCSSTGRRDAVDSIVSTARLR